MKSQELFLSVALVSPSCFIFMTGGLFKHVVNNFGIYESDNVKTGQYDLLIQFVMKSFFKACFKSKSFNIIYKVFLQKCETYSSEILPSIK